MGAVQRAKSGHLGTPMALAPVVYWFQPKTPEDKEMLFTLPVLVALALNLRGRTRMSTPTIQALGIKQEWATTSWRASGHVEGIGWLEAWGRSLVDAMAALQALAAERVAEQAVPGPDADGDGRPHHRGGGGGGGG